MEQCDILIVGSGVAGISAAKAIAQHGGKPWLVDNRSKMGGVLQQCLHKGFPNALNGPEYVAKLLQDFPSQIKSFMETTVLSVSKDRTAVLVGSGMGRRCIRFDQLILATGCYEIPVGSLNIAGTRPNGVYMAGQLQEMMNLYGQEPDAPIVILGSGDLGLIMASQLGSKGLQVTVVEKQLQCGGLKRNQECLKLPNVSLKCGCSVAEIYGEQKITGVRLTNETFIPCKSLVVAVGLRSERSLIAHLECASWIHLCGNCHKVHAMVETVVEEGERAGLKALNQWRNKHD